MESWVNIYAKLVNEELSLHLSKPYDSQKIALEHIKISVCNGYTFAGSVRILGETDLNRILFALNQQNSLTYINHKTRRLYEILHTATNQNNNTTCKQTIVYKEISTNEVQTRDADEFFSKFTLSDLSQG